MYKLHGQMRIEDFIFPYGKLNSNNRWVKLAGIIPWDKIEEKYVENFVNNGHPAKDVRIALGSLIIKQTLNCTDRETVNQVMENPYLQFFIGLKEFQERAPFSATAMVDFRKRFTDEVLAEINEMIITVETKENDDSERKDDNDDNNTPNNGTLIIDATCAPADIAYPQDLNLLNEARENLEKMIDELHDPKDGKKPRTYRNRARKDFLNTSKCKSKSGKKLRKAVGKQLRYIFRDIMYIERMLKSGKKLSEKQEIRFGIIKKLYEQQKYMFDNKKHSVDDRIVNISQPHVRPIVRGKAKAKTEFGAKVEISVVDGYVRIEKLSWDAYNEGDSLIDVVENYKERTGRYPERVLVDKIYRNRKNLGYCKENRIKVSGPALGRPKKDDRYTKKQEYVDMCDRNAVEGKFGEGKVAYGLNRIAAKLKETSQCVIGIIFLVMNLNKKLRILLYLFLELFSQNLTRLKLCVFKNFRAC